MERVWLKRAAIIAVALSSFCALTARADDDSVWLKDRQARFIAYRRAHPNPQAEIDAIKSRTAALVAKAGPVANLQAAAASPPVVWRAARTPLPLWDGADLPEMLVVPAGEYTIGSPASEEHRVNDEDPGHRVRIGYSFAVGKYPVTVGEYARFVAETHYPTADICHTFEGGEYDDRKGRNWRSLSFPLTPAHPAACINWVEAKAYTAWLAKKTGHPYRLLSEAEFEYLNRAGTTSTYWWGDEIGVNHTACNGCGSAWDRKTIPPVGSFPPNPFGLHDTTGDNWSWTEDCWNGSYAGAPTDGSPNLTGECSSRVLRGGSWVSHTWILRSAHRHRDPADAHHIGVGFRVARTL